MTIPPCFDSPLELWRAAVNFTAYLTPGLIFLAGIHKFKRYGPFGFLASLPFWWLAHAFPWGSSISTSPYLAATRYFYIMCAYAVGAALVVNIFRETLKRRRSLAHLQKLAVSEDDDDDAPPPKPKPPRIDTALDRVASYQGQLLLVTQNVRDPKVWMGRLKDVHRGIDRCLVLENAQLVEGGWLDLPDDSPSISCYMAEVTMRWDTVVEVACRVEGDNPPQPGDPNVIQLSRKT